MIFGRKKSHILSNINNIVALESFELPRQIHSCTVSQLLLTSLNPWIEVLLNGFSFLQDTHWNHILQFVCEKLSGIRRMEAAYWSPNSDPETWVHTDATWASALPGNLPERHAGPLQWAESEARWECCCLCFHRFYRWLWYTPRLEKDWLRLTPGELNWH